MYNERLRLFFKSKDLKQKEIAEILGYSPNMISRYLKGSDKVNSDFITVLVKKFPEIDLQYIFSEESNTADILKEPESSYAANHNVLADIEIIEEKLRNIKEYLAQKSHE